MTSHQTNTPKEWEWVPLRSDEESIRHNSPIGQRMPWESFHTHWVALGFYCSIYDPKFRKEFMSAIPVRKFEGTWYECLYDAMINLSDTYSKSYYVSLVKYLNENHKQYSNHALQLIHIVDKRDDFWMNLDQAKAYVAKNLLRSIR